MGEFTRLPSHGTIVIIEPKASLGTPAETHVMTMADTSRPMINNAHQIHQRHSKHIELYLFLDSDWRLILNTGITLDLNE